MSAQNMQIYADGEEMKTGRHVGNGANVSVPFLL